ncbi:EF-hand domain-containing family member B isoform X1 [Pangasianodon hypophthalmus]|uniref:EF-hand domain-containing family member B isoform X1 n=1 Tax=Pangasianodon hypophthalmus TaxID=310915 RepID=UPI0023078F42|nr:EF-hand domain-containing family member B isoform X1 [Pangasianodon hypophthalmus]
MMIVFERTSSAWRRRDTFPNIRAAGKVIPQGDRAQACLQEITPRSETPPVVRKFLNSTHPEPGKIRAFFGKADDPDIASTLVHGISTGSSINAGPVINPPPKTRYQERLRELREATYGGRQKAPIGRTQVMGPGLPNGLDPEKTTFGVKLLYSLKAGEIINPPKTAEQVEQEAQEGHEQYIRSHSSYFVGEHVNRKYDLRSYRKDSRFGVATPHRIDGHNTRKSLQWLCDTQTNHSAKFVSKRCDDFRERTQPQTGKVHDPIADTLRVPADHTFGALLRPDEFGAAEVLHATPPSEHRKGQDRRRALVSAVRQQLKKANFQNFTSLLQAFRHYDKKGQGRIDKEDLRDVCREFNLDLSADILDDLIDYCDVDKDGLINFLEFANFLSWKDKMPISQEEQRILTRERKPSTVSVISMRAGEQEADTEKQAGTESLAKSGDLEPVKVGSVLKTPKTLRRTRAEPERFITSSSAICGIVGELAVNDYRTYGVPSVRTDLAAPRIKRVSDRTNYGEEGTVYELLSPTLYSLFGVHERHLFCPRTKDEMEQIFRNAGLCIPDQMFEEVWSLASKSHPAGEVCVESFRNVLSELQAN